jgi:hypothetical protein
MRRLSKQLEETQGRPYTKQENIQALSQDEENDDCKRPSRKEEPGQLSRYGD